VTNIFYIQHTQPHLHHYLPLPHNAVQRGAKQHDSQNTPKLLFFVNIHFNIRITETRSWWANKRKQAVRVATQNASAPACWQYLRIYSPGGTSSGMLAL